MSRDCGSLCDRLWICHAKNGRVIVDVGMGCGCDCGWLWAWRFCNYVLSPEIRRGFPIIGGGTLFLGLSLELSPWERCLCVSCVCLSVCLQVQLFSHPCPTSHPGQGRVSVILISISCVCVCVSVYPHPFSYSAVSDSLRPHGLCPTSLLCPWHFPGKNTGLGCHFLPQRIFPSQGWKLQPWHLLRWLANSLPLCHLGSPYPFSTCC